MAEPTLQEVFGANATQDATDIVIKKADLAGLTPSASNTAESLLSGILLTAKPTLSSTNFASNIDQSLSIENGFSSFTTRGTNNAAYRVDQLNVNLAKLDTGATLDPDDY